MEVKLLDLVPQYRLIEDEIMDAVKDVFRTQQFVLGRPVSGFERKMEKYYGVERAIGTASGSDAILLSLMALGVGEGDEVVLIGTQGSLTITVSSFSDMNNSLNYELLTRLPKHIPRYVVD